MLQLLQQLIPLIGNIAQLGADITPLVNGVRTMFDEHRQPDDPEWDVLEGQITAFQNKAGGLRDTSRDVRE